MSDRDTFEIELDGWCEKEIELESKEIHNFFIRQKLSHWVAINFFFLEFPMAFRHNHLHIAKKNKRMNILSHGYCDSAK